MCRFLIFLWSEMIRSPPEGLVGLPGLLQPGGEKFCSCGHRRPIAEAAGAVSSSGWLRLRPGASAVRKRGAVVETKSRLSRTPRQKAMLRGTIELRAGSAHLDSGLSESCWLPGGPLKPIDLMADRAL